MKIKKILSSALLAVMIFTTLLAAFPLAASAAYSGYNANSGTSATAELNSEELTKYLTEYLAYDYSTAEEMLEDELAAGYLYSVNSANAYYSLYVNKYTGFVFYKNNVTGQILTSNPIDPGYKNEIGNIAIEERERYRLMSQIEISFKQATGEEEKKYTSYEWSALRSQIDVSQIANGLRVSYIIGDTTPRFLLPGAITVKNYEEYILIPMLQAYTDYLKELCQDKEPETNLDFFDNDEYSCYDEYGYINTANSSKNKGVRRYITETESIAMKYYPATSSEYLELFEIGKAVNNITMAYNMENPLAYDEDDEDLKKLYEDYPITAEGVAIYVCNIGVDNISDKRNRGNSIKTYCPDYNFSMMYADEKQCGYVDKTPAKPVFRCALEYSFNSDGSLSIRLPASSITFDETQYTLQYITPVQFFGCADSATPSYIFYPDGSGNIIELSDFYREGPLGKDPVSLMSTTYGKDYCYSKITGAHLEQVTMPVFGVVTETNANKTTSSIFGENKVTNGYFAILEEGSALANLGVDTGGASYKYGTAYATYNPYPSDECELSEAVTTTGAGNSYTIVSESKYTGSYVTRIIMLTDEDIGAEAYGEGAFYESSYVGMAAYYRNYLKENGTLSALELVSSDLPLYVEALGAMDIMTKVLTFPVSKSIALTTFDDIITMYKELSECKTLALQKSAEYEALAAASTDEAVKAENLALAKEYSDFAAVIEDISNINFKLTGFANGGLKYTYPSKAKWSRACGGASGYENLIAESNKISLASGVNFGVYADFDFMYIKNTAMFDGIGNRGNVAKMVDNRYASMQIYNSAIQEYESLFDLVISADALGRLYNKFNKDFSEYGSNKISLSTLGSDLNSNFDKDNSINRDEARLEIVELLDRVANQDGYEVMTDKGNIYAVKYATHILNVSTDSSHMRYSSYSIPFTGLVLHSYVNYTGTPLNYSGNVDYQILKSIENGAAPYYILCYQNSAYLKEDEDLNDYYGVSYENWYGDIVKTYAKINAAIGGLQDYEIVDHKIVISERIIEESEMQANYVNLQNEILELLDAQLTATVDAAFRQLQLGGAENYSKRVKVVVDRASLMAQFSEILNLEVSEFEGGDFTASVDKLIAEYAAEYPGDDANNNSYVVNFSNIEYSSKYSYITDSSAFDKDYVRTDYTIDNGNVTMVTYRKGDSEVNFLLNYNNFSVTVRLDANTEIVLEKFSYKTVEIAE